MLCAAAGLAGLGWLGWAGDAVIRTTNWAARLGEFRERRRAGIS